MRLKISTRIYLFVGLIVSLFTLTGHCSYRSSTTCLSPINDRVLIKGAPIIGMRLRFNELFEHYDSEDPMFLPKMELFLDELHSFFGLKPFSESIENFLLEQWLTENQRKKIKSTGYKARYIFLVDLFEWLLNNDLVARTYGRFLDDNLSSEATVFQQVGLELMRNSSFTHDYTHNTYWGNWIMLANHEEWMAYVEANKVAGEFDSIKSDGEKLNKERGLIHKLLEYTDFNNSPFGAQVTISLLQENLNKYKSHGQRNYNFVSAHSAILERLAGFNIPSTMLLPRMAERESQISLVQLLMKDPSQAKVSSIDAAASLKVAVDVLKVMMGPGNLDARMDRIGRGDHDFLIRFSMSDLIMLIKNLGFNSNEAGAKNLSVYISDVDKESGFFSFSVADDGNGMSDEVLAKVNDALDLSKEYTFFTTKGSSGNGQALEFFRQVLKDYNGTAVVERNDQVRGVTFIFRFPIAAPDDVSDRYLLENLASNSQSRAA